jgi:hypothetical protein
MSLSRKELNDLEAAGWTVCRPGRYLFSIRTAYFAGLVAGDHASGRINMAIRPDADDKAGPDARAAKLDALAAEVEALRAQVAALVSQRPTAYRARGDRSQPPVVSAVPWAALHAALRSLIARGTAGRRWSR